MGRHLQVGDVVTCVLIDTAEIMDRGFKDQLSDLIDMLPAKKQMCSFSQILQPKCVDFLSGLMQEPLFLHLPQGPGLSLLSVREFYVAIGKRKWKFDSLCDLLETVTFKRAVICCKDRRTLDFLVDQLSRRDFTTASVHPKLDQKEAAQALGGYLSGSSRFLIAMDFSTNSFRDLDNDLTQADPVINYDWPSTPDKYLLRVGTFEGVRRVAINFMLDDELRTMKNIE